MHVDIVEHLLVEKDRERAQSILNACVHCGFCTATCPTYLQTGNELDSPRGRIYLIKEMLETGQATDVTQQHLDRCLTCQSCETTCPSGVEYHSLLSIGRETVERLAPVNLKRSAQRWLVRRILLLPRLLEFSIACGLAFRPLLPKTWVRTWLVRRQLAAAENVNSGDRVLLQLGCVQPALRPDTDQALIRVLQHFGVAVETVRGSGCCGALSFHTSDEHLARRQAAENVDAWVEAQARGNLLAVVSSASGCGVQLKDYSQLLSEDKRAFDNFQDFREKVMDPAELILSLMRRQPENPLPNLQQLAQGQDLVFHCPCTLQHGLQLTGAVETIFSSMGIELPQVNDSHLCCGSAGSYSILQPKMANRLKQEKIENLQASEPKTIMTANIGCQIHLQSGTKTPVRHWLEIIAASL